VTFGTDYASAYDALYKDKDYPAEAAFALRKLAPLGAPERLHLLDLGCGTGLHALEFAKRGAHVFGVDLSADMLVRARGHAVAAGNLERRIQFDTGDIRSMRVGKTFDAVVSLFHVLCYMTTDADLDAALATARAHVRPGGLFLFDFWYGAAVLAKPPEPRERIFDCDGRHIHRTTTPEWDKERHVVSINYTLRQTELATGAVSEAKERHVIRYYFDDELAAALKKAGFADVVVGEWLSDGRPSAETFGVYALAQG
jgi:SAM-dependent methyltransferase